MTIVKPTHSLDPLSIEKKLRIVEGVRLDGAQLYSHTHVKFNTFSEWAQETAEVKDEDLARNRIYFGFQPLYDVLVENKVEEPLREKAIGALDIIMDAGISYLTEYYQGKPRVQVVRTMASRLVQTMKELDTLKYKVKFRNVDYNGITPQGIAVFLKKTLTLSLDGNFLTPDYVVGCACGSSEVAMPLAGIFETSLGFIRRSYRRGDSDPRIIREHLHLLSQGIYGKRVLCIEDYVCTGESLRRVMERVKQFNPSEVRGASVNFADEGRVLHLIKHEKKFNFFSLIP